MKPSPQRPGRSPSKTLFGLLLLASFTIITLDARGGAGSPVDPLRTVAGELLGPVEQGTTAAARPFRDVTTYLRTTGGLRDDLARLKAQNARLRTEIETSSLARNRAAELDGMLATSRRTGYALVPARVIAMGAAQTFSRTVTIDAGRSSGVRPDSTVVNNDGLVGRVIRADQSTATVLLIVDQESVVGGRLGSSMEIGLVHGRGRIGGSSPLGLELVDTTVVPNRNDVVTTWGSRNGVPYVAGIPVGRVTSVFSSPRQLSSRAVIEPFVDFSALDLVGVVVDAHTHGDRAVIDASRSTASGTSTHPTGGRR